MKRKLKDITKIKHLLKISYISLPKEGISI